MTFNQLTFNKHPSKRSQSIRKTKSTYAGSKSFTAMDLLTWSIPQKALKLARLISKRVMCSLELPHCAWVIMIRSQDNSDSLLCAMVRCIGIHLLAITLILSRVGLSLAVFKVVKMYKTWDSVRFHGVDGVIPTSTLLELKWQTIKASHQSWWECQDTLSSLSLWNRRASKI